MKINDIMNGFKILEVKEALERAVYFYNNLRPTETGL